MKRTKVLLVGANGRMGKELSKSFKSDSKVQLVFRVGTESDWEKVPTNLNVDIVVDFSSTRGLDTAIHFCRQRKVPLFSGTTGLRRAQKVKFKKLGEIVPVCWAPNCSLGIALVNRFLQSLGSMSGFRISVNEVHHKNKKDKPSGTALLLKEALKNKSTEVRVTSERKGNVIGIHEVFFQGSEENISIRHQANSRNVFAQGACMGLKKLVKKRPGLYSMADLFFN